MATLTIEIPDKTEKALTELINQLGGKVINVDKKLRRTKAAKKQQILTDLEESVNFIKAHQAGQVEAKTIEQFLSEL